MPGLCYVGRIQQIEPTLDSALVVAEANCGMNGVWRGMVWAADFRMGDKCLVRMTEVEIEAYSDTRLPDGAGVLVHEVGDDISGLR